MVLVWNLKEKKIKKKRSKNNKNRLAPSFRAERVYFYFFFIFPLLHVYIVYGGLCIYVYYTHVLGILSFVLLTRTHAYIYAVKIYAYIYKYIYAASREDFESHERGNNPVAAWQTCVYEPRSLECLSNEPRICLIETPECVLRKENNKYFSIYCYGAPTSLLRESYTSCSRFLAVSYTATTMVLSSLLSYFNSFSIHI